MDPEVSLGTQTVEITKQYQKELESRPHGKYYRYVSADILQKLMAGETIKHDPKKEFISLTESNKFNPNNAPAEKIVIRQAMEASFRYLGQENRDIYDNYLHQIRTLNNDRMQIARGYEDAMSSNGSDMSGFSEAISGTLEQKSMQPLIDFFKSKGGDDLMVELERSGWGMAAMSSFSDLIPVSAEAPAAWVGPNSDMVVIEMDLNRDEIVIPKDDRLNEHEMMVHEIKPENITYVYSSEDTDKIRSVLQSRYPDYFSDGLPLGEQLQSFNTEVPLDAIAA